MSHDPKEQARNWFRDTRHSASARARTCPSTCWSSLPSRNHRTT